VGLVAVQTLSLTNKPPPPAMAAMTILHLFRIDMFQCSIEIERSSAK
jgi:hypothetical protein